MKMFHFLQKRSIHSQLSRGIPPTFDLSFMLKKFKNFGNDEYSTSDDYGFSVPPMACAFGQTYQHGNILSVVDEDGHIVLYDVNIPGSGAVKTTWQAHANAIFDLSWAENDTQIMTASGDQTIALWEVEGKRKIDVFKGHTSSVKSVSVRFGDEAVFASGSRDGHIMMWDKRIFHKEGTIPPVDTIYNAHAVQQNNTPGKARKKKLQPKESQQSVTSVLFQDENYLVSCGAVDGCIKLWDMRKTHKLNAAGAVPVQVFNYPGSSLRRHGFSCLTLDGTRSRLFASCTDDNIYEFNMKSAEDRPEHHFRGHKNSTFYVKTAISPDNQILLSGSSDNHAYMWQVNKREAPPLLLKAHDAEVSSVAWCPTDWTKVVTLSDDAKTKIWRIYCRETKSSSLPNCMGRAHRFSKERSTSMVDTPPHFNRQLKQNSDTASPAQSPLGSKTQSTLGTSTPKSLKDWLKRKASQDKDTSEGPSPCKVFRTLECTPEQNKNSASCKRSYDVAMESSNATPHSSKHPSDCEGLNADSPSKRLKLTLAETPNTPHRVIDNESNYSSPRKLFKCSIETRDSPKKSPNRPCLTPLKENGQNNDIADRTSVKISLFADSMPNKDRVIENQLRNEGDSSNGSSQFQEESLTPLKQKLHHNLSDDSDHYSPTRNLPNLVMDQMTNLRPTSPLLSKSSQSKKLDWLTRLKVNKNKKGGERNPLPTVSTGVTKSSPKVSKAANMKKIHAYFKVQTDN